MSVFGKSKKAKEKVSYLSLEKVRISFVPGQDKVQLTGILDGISIKHTLPSGSSLESEFRNSLLLQEDDYWSQAMNWEENANSQKPLPQVAILNFGSKQHLSFEEAQKSPDFYFSKAKDTNVIHNITDFPQRPNDLKIPLGFMQNLYNRESIDTIFYHPFPMLETKPEGGYPARNIFIGGSPGRGKTVITKNLSRGIKALAPDVEVVIYDSKNYNGGEYEVSAIADLLEFLVKMRAICRDSRKKYFVIIEEIDSLIQFPQDQSWMEKRANKAIRAELLETIIFLTKHHANVSFAFSSQSPTTEHNGILETCETIVDLGVNFASRELLGYVHQTGADRSQAGRGFIKHNDFESPKVFQPYISVEID